MYELGRLTPAAFREVRALVTRIKELMDEVGTRNELTAATHARFREAGERYGSGAGEMTVCKVIEDDAGVDLRVAGDWLKPWEVQHSAAPAK